MLSADDVLNARFAATKFRPGYDQDEVDDLLDQVAVALRTGGNVGLDEVELQQTRWREGYDIAEVDAFLDEARASLASPRPVVPVAPVDVDSSPRPPWYAIAGDVLATMVVGEKPDDPPRRVKPGRAPRVSAQRITVGRDGISWRSRGLRTGWLAVGDIARVVTLRLEYTGTTSSTVDYALVLDHAGGVRLRVRLRPSMPRDFWEPLGVPVTRDRSVLGRPKDARRRWPEAISWAHAYPVVTTLLAAAGWMLVVVPVLDRLTGA
ncbi:DivIVA domain-containing protein [Cellulomonas sp. P5_C6]